MPNHNLKAFLEAANTELKRHSASKLTNNVATKKAKLQRLTLAASRRRPQ